MPGAIVTPGLNQGGVLAQRAQSPGLWDSCDWDALNPGAGGDQPGMRWFDDFQGLPIGPHGPTSPTTLAAFGPYQAVCTGTGTPAFSRSGTINSVVVPGGALQSKLTTTSANQNTIAQTAAQYSLSGVIGTDGALWFEAPVAVSTIAANTQGFFIGLMEIEAVTFGSIVPFTSGTGLAIDAGGAMIGFNLPTNGVGQIKTVYSDHATTFTAVGATDCTLMKANTFTRLGISYDPSRKGTSSSNPSTCCVQFWQDNVLLANGITKATLTGLTNLNAKALGLIWSSVAGSSVSGGINYLQWWKTAQYFPS